MVNSHSQAEGVWKKRVIIIHPLVPEYRRTLYEQMYWRLQRHGIELIVLNGNPSPRIRDRGDRIDAPWSRRVKTRWFRIGKKEIGYRSIKFRDLSIRDYVIIEQALKNLESLPLLLLMLLGKIHLGMWSHGKTYSIKQHLMLQRIKTWVTAYSERVFVYTDKGKDYLVQSGLGSDKIYVLNNSIDTDGLKRDLASVTKNEIEEFRRKHALFEGHVGIFIGGVDDSKGIDFLVSAARKICEFDSQFRLLIVGEGAARDRIASQLSAPEPIVFTGRLIGREKAIALRSAQLMLIPEWIGLVAVDSLVAGVPIISCYHFSHSP
jgi:glycosyltransferase involved in cell wall biosynthesis